MTSPLGFEATVGSLICACRGICVHLCCDTCWPLDSQHGSWADLFHILGIRHWWGSKPRPMEPQTKTTDWAMPTRAHSWASYFHIKTWMLTIVFRLHYDRFFNTFYVNILIVLSFCFHVFWQTVVDRKYFWLPRPEGAANHIRIVNPLQHQGHHLWALVC